ncbi:two-component system regulatory protein YycI [Lutispora thermophila]|nr:two-component system regulatory protein YycI [Lutispora thermophila]
MNWSRAKTILIILFLIADIFLFYELYSEDLVRRNKADQETAKEVIKYLEKQGIWVKCRIPKASLPKKTLTVKYKYIDSKYALGIFFDSPKDVAIKTYEDRTVLEDKKSYVEINKNGQLIYTNKELLRKKEEPMDEESALKNMKVFLKNIGIDDDDIYSISKKLENGYYIINCSQSYKGTFLDESHLELLVTKEGIAHMKILWFEVENNGKNKNAIIHPIKALMELAEEMEEKTDEGKKDLVINDISLGYYFDTDIEQVEEFDIIEVEEGTAIPVWKMETNMGNIYINAYNGTVEKN